MAQMSHPIKHDSLPAFPYVHIFGLLRIPFFVLQTKASASMALTNKNKKNKTTTTKQNNPPPPKKKKIKIKTTTTTTKNTKKTTKNSNKQITKTDKTQQTNVALATARAYKILCYKCVCILIILIYSEQHLG